MGEGFKAKKNQPPTSEKKMRPIFGEQTSRILEPSPQGLISSDFYNSRTNSQHRPILHQYFWSFEVPTLYF